MFDIQLKLSNTFTPDPTEAASSRVAAEDLELSQEEQELLLKIKEKKKELRKKERKEKNKKETLKDDLDAVYDNSDLEEVSGQDKSFESLASFTGDVSNKVGNVGDSVKTGVTVSIVI